MGLSPAPDYPVKVLVLEPDYWRFLGITQILRSDPRVIVLEPDSSATLEFSAPVLETAPDVILVAYSLILDHGAGVLQQLRTHFPNANLLVDGYDERVEKIAGVLSGGAKGYFLLRSDPPNLLKALDVVQQGLVWAPREALAHLLAELHHARGEPVARDQMSKRELAILRLLGRGRNNREIAKALGVAEVTVKADLTKLYRRFGVRTRLELLAYAVEHQLLDESASSGKPRHDS